MNEHRGLWRGKRIDEGKPEGEWKYGYYVYQRPRKGAFGQQITNADFEHDFIITKDGYRFEIAPSTLGECTCITDKNGKLIFEGDIVKTKKYGKIVAHSNVNDYDIFVVKYEPALFRLENHNRGFNLVDDGYSKFEIIGNIHDNPELLKATGEDIGNAAQDTIAPAT